MPLGSLGIVIARSEATKQSLDKLGIGFAISQGTNHNNNKEKK
jgi:hypothetical protein